MQCNSPLRRRVFAACKKAEQPHLALAGWLAGWRTVSDDETRKACATGKIFFGWRVFESVHKLACSTSATSCCSAAFSSLDKETALSCFCYFSAQVAFAMRQSLQEGNSWFPAIPKRENSAEYFFDNGEYNKYSALFSSVSREVSQEVDPNLVKFSVCNVADSGSTFDSSSSFLNPVLWQLRGCRWAAGAGRPSRCG